MQLVGKSPIQDVVKGLRKLQPTREVLLALLDTLKSVGAKQEIVEQVMAFCSERGCDPSQTPMAHKLRRTPSHTGDKRIYRVQHEQTGRPYFRMSLSTLEGGGDGHQLKRVEVSFKKRESGKPFIEIEAA